MYAQNQYMIFASLEVWIDAEKRSGPYNMAVDQWLLTKATIPVLRVYGWSGEWASLGYFGKIADARLAFPGVNYVRRITGGGLVDHRSDWTYSLIIPATEPSYHWQGAAIYHAVHQCLADALAAENIDTVLAGNDLQTGDVGCFKNPVYKDLVNSNGQKIAGAGQRRTKSGLLHQGSIAVTCPEQISHSRAEKFASAMSGEIIFQVSNTNCEAAKALISEAVDQRFAQSAWLTRR